MRTVSVGLFLLLLVGMTPQSFAQPPNGLDAKVSSPTYEPGDKVVISGTVQPLTDVNPVTIIVRNPIGNVYEVGQVNLSGNSFTHEFVLSDNAQGGTYTVNVRQDNQTSQMQFQVITGQTQIIPVLDSEIRASGKYTNLIKYGEVKVSNSDDSITIQVDSTRLQNYSVIEQFHIPKRVIDATGNLAVEENDKPVDCVQSDSETERTIGCPVQLGTADIKFIGTSVIPEFGNAALWVLGPSLLVAITLLSRNGLVRHFR